jgi:hypothetical protein
MIKKMKNQFKSIAITLFCVVMGFVLIPSNSYSQVDLNKLTKTGIDKVSKKKDKKNKGKTTESTNSQPQETTNTQAATTTVKEPSLLDIVKNEQKEIAANNKTVTENNSSEYSGKEVSEPAYLTFTNDFKNPNANVLSFTANDNIYAKLNINKSLYDLMPKEDDYNLQYYRVEVYAKAGSQSDMSAVKLKEKSHFKLAYSDKDILFAIAPDKAFFEYLVEQNIKAGKSKLAAYNDVISRNFSSRLAAMFSYLYAGEYKVEIEVRVMAKLQSDKYFKIAGIKGVFVLNIDDKDSQKFSELQQNMSNLYSEYEEKAKQEEDNAFISEQQKKLDNMTIEERNAYLDQMKPTGDGFSDNNYTVNVKNNNSGQSVRLLVTDLKTRSEQIHTIQPNSTFKLELIKGRSYDLASFGQNASKESAIRIVEVDQSYDGNTINIK